MYTHTHTHKWLIMSCSLSILQQIRLYKVGIWFSPEVLKGIGSSGKLVGIISTYPGTSPMLVTSFSPKTCERIKKYVYRTCFLTKARSRVNNYALLISDWDSTSTIRIDSISEVYRPVRRST